MLTFLDGAATIMESPKPVPIPEKSQESIRLATKYKLSYREADRIVQYAHRWSIPPKIAFSLVYTESRFDSMAKSKRSSATGYTQILVPTARHFAPGITRTQLLHPDTNLSLGFQFLHLLHKRYGSWHKALDAYYLGPAVADTLTEPDSYSTILLRRAK